MLTTPKFQSSGSKFTPPSSQEKILSWSYINHTVPLFTPPPFPFEQKKRKKNRTSLINIMASLPISFASPTARVYAATAAKGAGASKEEKGFLDWLLGNLQKEDQFYETDPILKKVEEKNSGGTGTASSVGGRKNSVAVPQNQKKKNGGGFGGFGGLFAKK